MAKLPINRLSGCYVLIHCVRYRAQLWYHNRHVHAYTKMDRLAGYDLRADDLELAQGDDITLHHVARDSKKRIKNNIATAEAVDREFVFICEFFL